jgi:DNA polymerase
VQPADWLVVGEPLDPTDGQQELLLDNMLRAIGASRTASSRTSRAMFVALTERAGASPARPGVDDRTLVSAAIAAAAPRCVIGLGRAAAATLLGREEPIGALRGQSHRHGEVAVVVTFSLAFLLRHPAEKAKAWLDLCLAVSTSEATSA